MEKKEIKFRAWDNEEKKFFKPIYEAYKGNLYDLSITTNGRILRRTMEYCAEDESRFEKRYELMQYTGLKDKNGVEIYEGDIMQRDNGNAGYGDPNQPDYLNFIVKDWLEMIINCPDFDADTLIATMQNHEVIGNIYETPEILQP